MNQPRPRRRGASAGSTYSGTDPHGTDPRGVDEVGEWVILQTSVRPSVRELVRSVCNGVTRATGERFTLREFLTDAIELHAARLARRYNHGQPWLLDARPLPPGRSLGGPSASSESTPHTD